MKNQSGTQAPYKCNWTEHSHDTPVGAFAKLGDRGLHHVRPSFCPRGRIGFTLTHFREIVHWGFVLNSVDEIQVPLKWDKNNTLYKKTHAVLHYFFADYEISRRNTMSRRLRYKHKKYGRVKVAEERVEEIQCLVVYEISTRSTEGSERPKKQ